jgi:hypothetical protein
MIDEALLLRAGLLAWKDADRLADRRALSKAFRDNWDRRIGKARFGGVWSISLAKGNLLHPASEAALAIPRKEWKNGVVTVEHAVPIAVLFPKFMAADTEEKMQEVVSAYNVAVVTHQENLALKKLGLQKAMPKDWEWGHSPTLRWELAGISVILA